MYIIKPNDKNVKPIEVNSMGELKSIIEESFFINGKDFISKYEVFDENGMRLKLSIETKINIGNWNYLTIKE